MTHDAEHAIAAWNQGQRRRIASATADRIADGMLAAGGMLLANVTLPLGVGLPAGRLGVTLGASLVCAGLAWITRARRRATLPRRPFGAQVPAHAARAAQAHRAA